MDKFIFFIMLLFSLQNVLADDTKYPELKTDKVENAELKKFKALPEPLPFKYALGLYNEANNPNIRLAQAELVSATAGRLLTESEAGIKVNAYGSLVAVKPSSILPDDYSDKNNDHEIGIALSKQLYDFGRQEALLSASDKHLDAAGLSMQLKSGENYLTILRNYFNVILADLRFNRDNEALAMAFIRFDRARVKSEMKKVSELEVLRLQNIFQRVNKERFKSETQQRLQRSILANSLNRPGQLPGDLEMPNLSTIPSLASKRELPELVVLENRLLGGNKQLQQLQKKLAAEQDQQQAYKADKYPILTAELETTWHSRELGGSDKARAGITMHVPIYQGGEYNAKLELSKSKIMSLEASIELLKMQLKQQALEIWLELSTLKQQLAQVESALDYREMYLDKSRTDYESELKSDLGDAMVQMSEAQLLDMETRFSIAYQWAKLDILAGDRQLYGMGNQ